MLGFNATGTLALGQSGVAATVYLQSVSASSVASVIVSAGLQFTKAVSAALTGAVTKSMQVGKGIAVGSATTAAFVKQAGKAISAAVTGAVSHTPSYAVGAIISVSCATAANMTRALAKTISATCVSASVLLRRAWIEKTKSVETWIKRPRY